MSLDFHLYGAGFGQWGPLPNKGKESQKEKLEDDNKVEEEEETDEKGGQR